VVSDDNDPESIAGVTAVLADLFGVSSGFIAVRLRRYGLIASGGER
jgi:hypothetical protein